MMFHMAEVAIGAAAARLLVSGCALLVVCVGGLLWVMH